MASTRAIDYEWFINLYIHGIIIGTTHSGQSGHGSNNYKRVLQTHQFSRNIVSPSTPRSNECPGYDSKQSDGEVPVTLGLLGMRNTPSLPLWPEVVAPGSVRLMSQIELNCVLMLNWIAWNRNVLNLNYLLMLNSIVWKGTVFVC